MDLIEDPHRIALDRFQALRSYREVGVPRARRGGEPRMSRPRSTAGCHLGPAGPCRKLRVRKGQRRMPRTIQPLVEELSIPDLDPLVATAIGADCESLGDGVTRRGR